MPLTVRQAKLKIMAAQKVKYRAWEKRMETDEAFRDGWKALEEFLNDHRERDWVPVAGGGGVGWRRYQPGVDGPNE